MKLNELNGTYSMPLIQQYKIKCEELSVADG